MTWRADLGRLHSQGQTSPAQISVLPTQSLSFCSKPVCCALFQTPLTWILRAPMHYLLSNPLATAQPVNLNNTAFFRPGSRTGINQQKSVFSPCFQRNAASSMGTRIRYWNWMSSLYWEIKYLPLCCATGWDLNQWWGRSKGDHKKSLPCSGRHQQGRARGPCPALGLQFKEDVEKLVATEQVTHLQT